MKKLTETVVLLLLAAIASFTIACEAEGVQERADRLLEEAKKQQQEEIGEQTSRLQSLEEENRLLTEELARRDSLSEDVTELTRKKTETEQELQRLEEALEALSTEYQQLQQTVVELEQVPPTVEPQYILETPLCTGSMEPDISCLDRVKILTNFQPEEIQKDYIIVFEAKDCESLGDGDTMHRVVDIAIDEGRYTFETRGDRSFANDGCWTPASRVLGYVTEIEKDVVPENTALRNLVNEAYENFIGIRNQVMAFREQHCPEVPQGEQCPIPLENQAEGNALADEYDYRQCLHFNALQDAKFQRVDEVPVKLVCIDPSGSPAHAGIDPSRLALGTLGDQVPPHTRGWTAQA